MTPCFRFTSLRFSGFCRECGANAEWHYVAGRLLCAACCPYFRQVQAFDVEPLPGDVTGDQTSLFERGEYD